MDKKTLLLRRQKRKCERPLSAAQQLVLKCAGATAEDGVLDRQRFRTACLTAGLARGTFANCVCLLKVKNLFPYTFAPKTAVDNGSSDRTAVQYNEPFIKEAIAAALAATAELERKRDEASRCFPPNLTPSEAAAVERESRLQLIRRFIEEFFALLERHRRERTVVVDGTKYRGVTWRKQIKRWVAQITEPGFQKYVGTFTDKLEAAYAHDEAAIAEFGDRAILNFPREKQAWASNGTPAETSMTGASAEAPSTRGKKRLRGAKTTSRETVIRSSPGA